MNLKIEKTDKLKSLFESRVTNNKSRPIRILTFVFICLIFVSSAGVVQAENDRKNTFIRMEETEIIGIIEHPEITYIIPKTRIRFSHIPLERDFAGQATRFTDPEALESEARTRSLLSPGREDQ